MASTLLKKGALSSFLAASLSTSMDWYMGPKGRRKGGRLVPKMEALVVYSNCHFPVKGSLKTFFVGFKRSRSVAREATLFLSSSVASTPRARPLSDSRSCRNKIVENRTKSTNFRHINCLDIKSSASQQAAWVLYLWALQKNLLTFSFASSRRAPDLLPPKDKNIFVGFLLLWLSECGCRIPVFLPTVPTARYKLKRAFKEV